MRSGRCYGACTEFYFTNVSRPRLRGWAGGRRPLQVLDLLRPPSRPEVALWRPQGGVLHTASPSPSPVQDRGSAPPLGVNGSVSVSVSPSAR